MAVPEMVRPVVTVPAPMVDDAYDRRPAFRIIVVEVATPSVSGVQEKVPDPLPHAAPADETTPDALICRHSVDAAAIPEIIKFVVLAVFEIDMLVVVALVVVAFRAVKFWRVVDAVTRRLPDIWRVASGVAVPRPTKPRPSIKK